ncbi:MAG: ion transporter [Chloroflexota bacterium]|nr:ion transporter [Chloroflexota bacterium]
MQTTLKRRIFGIIDARYDDQDATRFLNLGMLFLISLNVIAAILETEKSIYSHYAVFFKVFEAFSVGVFTIEYMLRIWTCTEYPEYSHPVVGRLRFVLSPFMLIDLLSFLPFYIPIWQLDLRMLRIIRLFRLFRLLKMGRYAKSLVAIQKVLRAKREELGLTIFSGAILLIISSNLLYIIEHEAQPDRFASIPQAMWWGVVTLTTVGYGDIYPITPLGKIIGAIIAMLGIGLFALPAGIIASGFAAELQPRPAEALVCPHCGKVLDT